ncbi:MAG: alpha-hydroxy-acid oxidizing protein [Planctomycetes bacterium]|nr:alpha-hydroxy-acid oxidizing protein [Planctomycetota bacterium]
MATLQDMLSVDAFEAAAAGRLGKVAHDYYRSGAWGERTVRENVEAWSRLWLRPRCMVDVSVRDASVDLLGVRSPSPLLVAPTALHRMAHDEGEVATARAAGVCGIPMVLSSLSTCTIESVASATTAPLWMQIYISQDRGFTRALAQRAEAAGCRALMVTVDTPVWGVRERDIHNGFRVPDGMRMANLERPGQPTGHTGRGIGESLGWTIDASLTWKDLEMLRGAVKVPVLVKGVLRGDDAAKAIEHGAAGVVVSNHGGRQLDGAIATATALPDVVQAVAGRVPVIVDGGIRRGTDMLRALAMGATAVQVGRPVLWGLAVGGSEGVERVLRTLMEEFSLAMALAGCAKVADIRADLLQRD